MASEHNLESYGQHYLDDENVIIEFVNAAKLSSNDIVTEVGAGDGRITKALAVRAKKVIAYEIDTRTENELRMLQLRYRNIEVRWKNFLKCEQDSSTNKIVASIPYQITEPFIEKVSKWKLDLITLIVGKTFADNICAECPTTKLSLLTKCYYHPQILRYVDRKAFLPPPRTASAVIRLYPLSYSDLLNTPTLFLMRELFEQRDKKILNGLREGLIRLFQAKGQTLTKRISKEYIRIFREKSNLDFEKGLEQMTNVEIMRLYYDLHLLLEISR